MNSAPELLRQGVAQQRSGNVAAALRLYREAAEAAPENIEAWCRVAAAAESLQDWTEAADAYRRALALKPDFAEVHCNLGAALLRLRDLGGARESFQQAVRLKPDFAVAFNGLGAALKASGELAGAAEAFRQALAIQPQYPDAAYNLGNCLQALDDPHAAVQAYEAALGLDKNKPEILQNYSAALSAARRYREAENAARRLLQHRPRLPEAHNALGNALVGLGRLDEAAAAFSTAIELRPDYAEAICNLGNVALAKNQPDEALAQYRRAEHMRPDFAEARFNQAIALLLDGKLREGFELYEYRWDSEQKKHRRTLSSPRWTGAEPLEAKTIHVHCEQGIGDTIQFARYIPLLAERGANVVFEVQAPVMSLFADFPSTMVVCRQSAGPIPQDYHIPLLSLPRAFGTDLTHIPAHVPYIRTHPAKRAAWSARMAAYSGPRVGVVCSGNARHKNDQNRSISLARMTECLLPFGPLHLVQKDVRSADAEYLQASGAKIVDWSADLKDFAETAALLQQLDLLITVDTSAAHLAGALGVKTWVLLPYAPDWRWLLSRNDSPWYPTMKLYRQPKPGDWNTVLAQVAADLSSFRIR
jgi:tetratricopeptide (TPR) repeat protein